MANDSGLDTSTARLLSIGMAFLAGVLAGAVLVAAVPGLLGGPVESGPDPQNPPYTTASGGPSCFDGDVTPNAGWVHEVAVGDSYAVTLNATVVHEPGTEIRADVIPRSGNGYELALRTESVTPDRSFECERVHTEFSIAASLPTSYQRLIVTMNGRELVGATREDTTGDLYPLPNPLNATG
ncbi:hypothetical protein [Halobellus ordinarius]|uniref:hypothetical protein n=1 Tax=Halobellus ordinarius TaxID=3075120 RepID=UPI0028802FBD|nr:hypothetical protein [Halobellus sp. ZY16]